MEYLYFTKIHWNVDQHIIEVLRITSSKDILRFLKIPSKKLILTHLTNFW